MAYFRTLGDRAAEKQPRFVGGDWKGRWLPAWEGLLELNGDNGFLVGSALTQADVAVWDALDSVVTSVEGADFGSFGRVETFYQSIMARRRHVEALQNAYHSLMQAQEIFAKTQSGELVAEDLRLAQQYLSEITGEFTSDDLLGKIFSKFCIGK